MTITYTANMTCGFSESVRDLDQIFVTGYRFLGEVGDGPELTATESDGCDTDGDGLEDKDELGERVALSDSLAGRIATIFSGISEMEAENTEIAFEWKSDPTKADTDDDGADDKKERGDVGSDGLPSNVKTPDVIHVFPATDEEFRNQHENFSMRDNGKEYEDYDGYIRRIIDNTNNALEYQFRDEKPTPYLVTTTNENGKWGRWDNPDAGSTSESDTVYGIPERRFPPPPRRSGSFYSTTRFEADSTTTEMNQMREELEWPVRDGEVDRRGADVLSGFSGQPMGDPDDGLRGRVAGQFIDAAEGTPEGDSGRAVFDDEVELTGGATIIGTDDPELVTNPETVDNYYMHELGHVLGAIHPSNTDGDGTRFEVPSNTPGVMCKDDCAGLFILEQYIEGEILVPGAGPIQVELPGTSIANSMNFVDENEFRIRELDYDYMDADDPLSDPRDNDEGPSDDTLSGPNTLNEPRNISTVSTAASTEPPDENVDIEP